MALQLEQETYKIIGTCMNVHKALGNGFLESVYQEAWEKEMTRLQIPFVRHKKLVILFNGELLNKFFVADFVCYDKIILETKASIFLIKRDSDQVINYLSATELTVGLLVNFWGIKIEVETLHSHHRQIRIINTNYEKQQQNICSRPPGIGGFGPLEKPSIERIFQPDRKNDQ